jgi:putative NADH-flavin reductase
MKVVVFGASGATGQLLLRQGLARNLEMTAFVRNPKSVPPREHLRIVTGDVYNAEEVGAAIAGQDAVLSALGSRTLGKNDLLEAAMNNILNGMKRNGVKRLIVLGAGGSSESAKALEHQSFLTRTLYGFLLDTILKNPMASQSAQTVLMIASEADFTIVQPPRLTNGRPTGKYRVAADAFPPHAKATPRADVASFMLSQLEDRNWIRQMPFLCV